MNKLKGFVLGLGLVFAGLSPLRAEELISGFWSVQFGDSFPQAVSTMEANKSVIVFDSLDYRLGRTVLWRGTFFNKLCLVQMWFGNKGMWRAQVSFKTDDPMTVAKDLEKTLTEKYGAPVERSFREGYARTWKTATKTLDLTAAPHSGNSGYETVLTYTDRARMPK